MLKFFQKICVLFFLLLFIFIINRLFFILINVVHFSKIELNEIFQLLYKPLPLDISTASYCITLPFLIGTIGLHFNKNWNANFYKVYFFSILLILNCITAIDIITYREMGVKIHFKLFSHLQHPVEVIQSVALLYWIIGLTAISGVTLIYFYFFKNIINKIEKPDFANDIKLHFLTLLIAFLFSSFLIVIGIRGGLQPIPINESEVYFSKNNFINAAAVNPSWRILHSYFENRKIGDKNTYQFLSNDDATKQVSNLFQVKKDTTISFLKVNRPNICFIILESWSADMIQSYGGIQGITPNFDKLKSEGLSFTKCYASGTLSDQGIPAVLSAYPAQPITSIIANEEKYPSMHCINTDLKNVGYHTSFYFGGQLIYGNIKSYLYYHNFDVIKEQKNYPNYPSGALGINDSIMLNTWLNELNTYQQPFFSGIFTLSTHAPFDAPMQNKFKQFSSLNAYTNSVHYADKCLMNFFTKAKKTKWYANTLFVLISDHSHESPMNQDYYSAAQFHIPLLFIGGAIKNEFVGKQIVNTCSQNDIVATILAQLNLPKKHYNWSKNLMNPYTKHFAYYSFTEGGAFVNDATQYNFNKLSNLEYYQSNNTNNLNKYEAKKNMQSFLQKLMD
ncbi:MAG: hypothetical protein RIQ33_2226, partial [Bacteroidota bacterium]